MVGQFRESTVGEKDFRGLWEKKRHAMMKKTKCTMFSRQRFFFENTEHNIGTSSGALGILGYYMEMMKNPTDSPPMLKRHFVWCTCNQAGSGLARAELVSDRPGSGSKLNSAGVSEFLCCPLQHHRTVSMNALRATYKLILWPAPSRKRMIKDDLGASA